MSAGDTSPGEADFSDRFLAPAVAGPVAPARPPRFSVIIAAYNVSKFIGEAIESVLAQTYPSYEIVVCDDGSTDDLDTALAPYVDRIVLIRQENGGESSAKNAAARATSGDYVVILDADDTFDPRRLEALAALLSERPDLDIATTDAVIARDGEPLRHYYADRSSFATDDQRAAIVRGNFVFGLAAVRRTRWLEVGGFDEAIRFTADWEFWIRLVLSGSQVGLVYEPLADYRMWEGTLTAQRLAYERGKVQTLTKTLARGDLTPDERAIVAASLKRRRREALLIEVEATLREGGAGVRGRLLGHVGRADLGALTRAKLVAAAVAPGHARKRLLERERRMGKSRLVRPNY